MGRAGVSGVAGATRVHYPAGVRGERRIAGRTGAARATASLWKPWFRERPQTTASKAKPWHEPRALPGGYFPTVTGSLSLPTRSTAVTTTASGGAAKVTVTGLSPSAGR